MGYGVRVDIKLRNAKYEFPLATAGETKGGLVGQASRLSMAVGVGQASRLSMECGVGQMFSGAGVPLVYGMSVG